MEIKNAIIQSTMLGIEDHGIMTFYLTLDYGGTGQGAGGYCLDSPIKKNGKFLRRVGTAYGMTFIMDILKVVGVDNWEDLKGKAIRVKSENRKLIAIGHLIKDDWLDFVNNYENIKPLLKLIEEI